MAFSTKLCCVSITLTSVRATGRRNIIGGGGCFIFFMKGCCDQAVGDTGGVVTKGLQTNGHAGEYD